jgi:hypothetical protein
VDALRLRIYRRDSRPCVRAGQMTTHSRVAATLARVERRSSRVDPRGRVVTPVARAVPLGVPVRISCRGSPAPSDRAALRHLCAGVGCEEDNQEGDCLEGDSGDDELLFVCSTKVEEFEVCSHWQLAN